MKMVPEQAAFLLDVCKLIEHATVQGFTVTGGELWRPIEMQELYVKTGRSKTMQSKHLDRLAIDLNFFKDGVPVYSAALLDPLGAFWESLSPKNVWGGRWTTIKDRPHFQRSV